MEKKTILNLDLKNLSKIELSGFIWPRQESSWPRQESSRQKNLD